MNRWTSMLLALGMLACSACQKSKSDDKAWPPPGPGAPDKTAPGPTAAPGAAPASAPVSADEAEEEANAALGEKLNAYIDCGNSFTNRVYESRDRYLKWCDPKKGPTGHEGNNFGIYSLPDVESCVSEIAKVKAIQPSAPELEKAADAYAAALTTLEPIVKQAYDYYHDEDFKDDKMAKGKEMHPKLMAAFDQFAQAQHEFSRLVAEKNDALHVRSLALIEKREGRSIHFLHLSAMQSARKVVEAGARNLKEIDLAELTAATAEYGKLVEELEAALDKDADKEEVGKYSSVLRGAKDYLTGAKALVRRVRDKVPYSQGERDTINADNEESVEGSPGRLLRLFNDLVDDSNRME